MCRNRNGWIVLVVAAVVTGCGLGSSQNKNANSDASDPCEANGNIIVADAMSSGSALGAFFSRGSGGNGMDVSSVQDASSGPSMDSYSSADAGTEPEPDPEPARQGWQVTENPMFATVSVGGGQSLELVKMRVTTHVEGLRARTLVDHIYYNPHASALEGTFRYPLPAEASVSYYAMFVGADPTLGSDNPPAFFGSGDGLNNAGPGMVAITPPEIVVQNVDTGEWGTLREGQIVKTIEGQKVYEDITRQVIDPAFVEQVAPNTYQAKVFPIPAHGYNRVLIAYEQTLPRIGEQLEYGFAIPEGAVDSLEFSLFANGATVQSVDYLGTVADVDAFEESEGRLFHKHFQGESPGGTFVFQFEPTGEAEEADVLCGTNPKRLEDYCQIRLQPNLSDLQVTDPGVARAVFLLDTSLSEHPDRFNINLMLLEEILASSPAIEEFSIITFDAGARWWGEQWMPNNAAQVGQVMTQLQSVLLEGATNFGSALRRLATPPSAMGGSGSVDVFVLSDGVISWGDSSITSLLQTFEASKAFDSRFFVYRTGLGAENLELYDALTRKGAIFNCMSAESVAGCATAHQATGIMIDSVTVEGAGGGLSEVLVQGRQATLFPGAQLTVAGRLSKPGPATVHINGTLSGSPVTIDVPVTLSPTGQLAPRAWAEIAVSQLLQTHDEALEDVAMALSQHYRIANRIASFLVLETDAEYELYELDVAFGEYPGETLKTLLDAAYSVGTEAWTSWDLMLKVFTDANQWNQVLTIDDGSLIDQVVGSVSPAALEIPVSAFEIPLVFADEVPEAYASGMTHAPEAYNVFRDEASRRQSMCDLGGAVRALSSIVENNPGDAEVSRQIGYRMSAWSLVPEAAGQFFQVLRSRPYEPQSYRDLANALGLERPALSSLLYEATLAGNWDPRFHNVKTVVEEEYGLFIHRMAKQQPDHPLNDHLAARKSALNLGVENGDIRVTITWNTNNTDIDLWVTDPNNERCYYGNQFTTAGAELLDDVTQGFGPERVHVANGAPGKYVVQVHYYGNNGNKLTAETYVNATIVTHAGTEKEAVQDYLVVLPKSDNVATVAEIVLK